MMRGRLRFLGICALLLALPITAQENASESPLLDMLRYVPDHVANRKWIQFGDLEAWYESWGIERIPDRDTLLALKDASTTDFLAFTHVMPSQTLPPEILGTTYFMIEDMRATYGFDIFSANRYLMTGELPDLITIVEDESSAATVPIALAALDYTSQPITPDGTLYSYGEDYEFDFEDRSLPHVAWFGNLNRIALLNGTMLIARATHVIEKALDTANGDLPSLADDPSYRAVAAALEEVAASEDAWLTGAVLTTSSEVGGLEMIAFTASMEEAEALVTLLEEAPPLPAYTVAAVATLHKPGTSYSVIALVFPQGTDASAAAASVDERFRTFTSFRTGQPFTEILAEHSARIVDSRGMDAGRPVALLIVADDDPTFEATDDAPLPEMRVFNFFPFVNTGDTLFLNPLQLE